VVVRAFEGSAGKFVVEFPPSGSGEYFITAHILDKDGLQARVKGTPLRLSLKLPESLSLSRSRSATPVLHSPLLATPSASNSPSSSPSSKFTSSREDQIYRLQPTALRLSSHATPSALAQAALNAGYNLDTATTPELQLQAQQHVVPSNFTSASAQVVPLGQSEGQITVAQGPSSTSAQGARAPLRPQPALLRSGSGSGFAYFQHPGKSISPVAQTTTESEEEGAVETDAARCTMWSHAFQIEAHSKKGARTRGGDKFEIDITGPNGPVEGAASIADLGNGKYQVRYTLPGAGRYSVRVTLGGKDIAGSPFVQTHE